MTNKNRAITRQSDLRTPLARDDRRGILTVSILLFSFAILSVGWAVLLDDSAHLFQHPYLLPSIFLVSVVLCIPVVYLVVQGSFDLFHPLVFAVWIYFFPAFVLGSLYLATGLHDRYLGLVPNPEYYLPLTLNYITLGFAGLTLGFAVPLGRGIGETIARKLPRWDWDASDIFRPAIFLVIIGELFKLGAFAAGNLGFQSTQDISTYGATLYMLGFFSTMGSFLLWFAIFRTERLMLHHYLGAVLLLMLVAYTMVLGGGKGGLFSSMVVVIGAYVLSGRRVNLGQALVIGLLITGALFVGMAYGTVFRQIKRNESQISLQDYLGFGSEAFDQLSRQGLNDNLAVSMDAFFPRIEVVSQLAVYVAHYKKLQPMESSYGVPDMWTMTWAAFIPRAIWPNKPNVSGSRGLTLLYFNVQGTSAAVTPMIDLLRNFGPIGILPGMALLGVILRIMYSALIRGQKIFAWRAVGYYLLLTSVSYEGMYGGVLQVLIRVCIVFSVGLALLYIMIPRRSRESAIDIFKGA
jgi:hypothetical protein